MNKELYNQLISCLEIENITLGEAQMERHWAKSTHPGQALANMKIAYEQPVVLGGELWAKAKFAVEVQTVETAGGESQPLFALDFVLDARYSVSPAHEGGETIDFSDAKEELRYFSEHNLPINVWPYAREFISSISVRMGFPPLVIGVHKSSASR